ncbi:hypothetical protein [Cysteiniphilum halobium]|uniref:hypothetical protein n=1 Tax=Cysteiniphilum halobium TaxID=2219059 RepID=UPI000E65AE4C|nr:hypothetical protein [Cysteiniphilum halobium]
MTSESLLSEIENLTLERNVINNGNLRSQIYHAMSYWFEAHKCKLNDTLQYYDGYLKSCQEEIKSIREKSRQYNCLRINPSKEQLINDFQYLQSRTADEPNKLS